MTVRSRATRRWRVSTALAVLAIAVGACNALNGSQDRELAEDAGGPAAIEAGAPALDASTPVEAHADATNAPYVSENDASLTIGDGSVSIASYPASEHTVVLPSPPRKTGSEAYTVIGTFRIDEAAEFGLFVRGQPDGTGYVVASEFDQKLKLSIGVIGPPSWNPGSLAASAEGIWSPTGLGQTLTMKVRVTSSDISAKIWDVKTLEPTEFPLTFATASTGQIVGFYVFSSTAVFLIGDLTVTIP